ncbi:MAG: serine--tRNA ligase [Candidatus Bathyarchaeota archaeon]|nr:serine--tRNA ligase [Candidatus Bathyarchaeota archaeon]MDH5745892.1 serine--tRNA ligase [Candidatus Bathyarchaeota archaeon]
MLDIKLIRASPELIRNNLKKRGDPENLRMLEELIEYDKRWRQLLTRLNELRHERRSITTEIAALKKKGKDVSTRIPKAKTIDKEITALEKQVNECEEKTRYYLMRIPNLLHESVSIGKDEHDNAPVRAWGETPKFSFPVKDHIDLGLSLDIMDIERAGKIAGARFFYLKREGVLLDMALMSFALEEMVKKDYMPIEPPFLMRRKLYEGVVALSDFENDLYKVENEDLYLIATSEHPMAAMFMNEVLKAEELPLKLVGVSANFRKEAGAHGKDTRGIFRTHQFNKIEQFVFCKPEDSWQIHEELIQNAEELLQKLGLSYRVVNVCTGDIGTVAAKKYDIEAWMPAQNAYREIISCSNCTDYQARRLNIKYREKKGEPPKGFVHTLNSTAIATGRTIVAILENYQQEDGSVIVPEVLRKYMGDMEKIEPKR